MKLLTEEQIVGLLKNKNGKTGVDGRTREMLSKIDLDTIEEISQKFIGSDLVYCNKDGKLLFKHDSFTPRAGSIYLKPSFAGRQIIMGKNNGLPVFSNGQWFSIC